MSITTEDPKYALATSRAFKSYLVQKNRRDRVAARNAGTTPPVLLTSMTEVNKASTAVLSNNNLTVSATNTGHTSGDLALTTGKWYWEVQGNGYAGGIVGVTGMPFAGTISSSGDGGSGAVGVWEGGLTYYQSGSIASPSYTPTDIIGVAVDVDLASVDFYKNNVLMSTITFATAGVDATSGVLPVYNAGTAAAKSATFNFGATAFAYTPPTDYLAIGQEPPVVPLVYGTMSEDNKASTAVLTNGNLTVSATNTGHTAGNTPLTTGKWYWEVQGTGYAAAIVGTDRMPYGNSISASGSGAIGAWELGNIFSGAPSTTASPSYTSSDVMGVALDMDLATVTFYKNNVSMGVFPLSPALGIYTGSVLPAFNAGTAAAKSATFNFGASGFTYTPPADHLPITV